MSDHGPVSAGAVRMLIDELMNVFATTTYHALSAAWKNRVVSLGTKPNRATGVSAGPNGSHDPAPAQ